MVIPLPGDDVNQPAVSNGDACVPMPRKTIMQMVRAGEDVNLAVARDARVTKGVMLAHDVSEEDAAMKAKADRMYRRIGKGLTAGVAEAFEHRQTERRNPRSRNPCFPGWLTGLEPATLGTTNRCSNQLSYSHRAPGI